MFASRSRDLREIFQAKTQEFSSTSNSSVAAEKWSTGKRRKKAMRNVYNLILSSACERRRWAVIWWCFDDSIECEFCSDVYITKSFRMGQKWARAANVWKVLKMETRAELVSNSCSAPRQQPSGLVRSDDFKLEIFKSNAIWRSQNCSPRRVRNSNSDSHSNNRASVGSLHNDKFSSNISYQ